MAGVSKSALQKVKSAMVDYSSESQSILHNLSQQANASVSQCSQQLDSVVQKKNCLQSTVENQRKQIMSINQKIDILTSEIRIVQTTVSQIAKKSESCQQKISRLNLDLSRLRTKLSQANGEDEINKIREMIQETENDLHATLHEKQEIERQLDHARSNMRDKQCQQESLKRELSLAESLLVDNEHRLRVLSDKCDRLSNAFSAVLDSVEGLISASKRLQGNDRMDANIACIGSCIACLDEYLSVDF